MLQVAIRRGKRTILSQCLSFQKGVCYINARHHTFVNDAFACRLFHATGYKRDTKSVPVIYVEPNGYEKEVQAEIGKNLLDVAHDNDIELEGACGGELACATCHLVFEQEIYDTLPEKVDEEDDMLDLAFELTETSRLGCQICVREDFAGMKVQIPDDGF